MKICVLGYVQSHFVIYVFLLPRSLLSFFCFLCCFNFKWPYVAEKLFQVLYLLIISLDCDHSWKISLTIEFIVWVVLITCHFLSYVYVASTVNHKLLLVIFTHAYPRCRYRNLKLEV